MAFLNLFFYSDLCVPSTLSAIPVNTISQPTGIIADKSLEILATELDPIVQILVAISFPIASVIIVGSCFFFMLGNSEKAWPMIMNAGLGYVLINLSPLFLQILKQIGEGMNDYISHLLVEKEITLDEITKINKLC